MDKLDVVKRLSKPIYKTTTKAPSLRMPAVNAAENLTSRVANGEQLI